MFNKITFSIMLSVFMIACSDKSVLTEKMEIESSGNEITEIEVETNITQHTTSFDTNEEQKNTQPEDNSTTESSWQAYLEHFTINRNVFEGNITYPHFPPTYHKNVQYYFDSLSSTNAATPILQGVHYDQNITKSGDRSIRFHKANDALILTDIPVEEGKWYVISGYMYVTSLPADVMRYYVEFMDDKEGVDIPNYPMFAISKAKKWEEFVLPIYIKKDLNISSIKVVFRDIGKPNAKMAPKSDVWIDDISIREVKDSASLFGLTPPSKKQVFDGGLVKVDSLGNFSIKNKETFEPFLPVIIYPGGTLDSWQKYKDKGFNTVICNTLDEAQRAVELGMYWIWSLYDYGIYDGDADGYARFEKEYQYLKNEHPEFLNKLLYFYWDNERYQLFDTVKYFADTIKKIDVDFDGNRLRPFTMQLDFTMANSHYVNEVYTLVDLQSCYANPMVFEDNDPLNYQGVEFKGNYDGEFANFAIFEHLPGVKIPKSVFVVNSPFGDKHITNTIFAAFARGGRGFAYWKDGGSQPKVDTKIWWKDFNKTTQMMQQLLPLLRTPHWTSWDLNVSLPDDEDGLVVGKRDFGDNKRCIIAASRSNKEEKVSFSGLDIPNNTIVMDYFSGQKVTSIKSGAFELKFAPRGYGVYCWDCKVE